MSETNFVENNQNENEKVVLEEQRKCCICNFLKNIKKIDLIIILAVIIFLILVSMRVMFGMKLGKETKVMY